MQHIHGNANIDKEHDHDQQEVDDVTESSQDESHVERRLIKQTEPVNYGFGPLTEQYESAQSSQRLWAGNLHFSKDGANNPKRTQILEQIEVAIE